MQRFKVVGVKRWKGALDGKSVDSAKLFVEVSLDDSRNGEANGVSQFAAGMATEELKCRDGEVVKAIERTPLPCYCELETHRVSNGRESKEVVIGARLVKSETPLKAA